MNWCSRDTSVTAVKKKQHYQKQQLELKSQYPPIQQHGRHSPTALIRRFFLRLLVHKLRLCMFFPYSTLHCAFVHTRHTPLLPWQSKASMENRRLIGTPALGGLSSLLQVVIARDTGKSFPVNLFIYRIFQHNEFPVQKSAIISLVLTTEFWKVWTDIHALRSNLRKLLKFTFLYSMIIVICILRLFIKCRFCFKSSFHQYSPFA